MDPLPADLLHRHGTGELEVDIVGVASNHLGDAPRLAKEYGITFEYLDTTNVDKPAIEENFWDLCAADKLVDGIGPLHANSLCTLVRARALSNHQHPSLVFAGL